ncbi:MAG: nuclear transport factor 2 family protein, partial [Pseudomonadota bacterium]|nr:nuclear transport factor 2 family protein [Pseudomonadota bacterium]
MSGTIADPAAQAIYRYAHGMDRKRFDEAAAVFADGAEIDYSAVGGPKARMSRSELQVFLTGLLGRSELSVHTAVAQVLPGAGKPGTT